MHAKYDTRTAEPVVGDGDWGHLQLDATSLFLLMLAQMTASGLRIVFTLDEVDFVQNLVHYLGRAYHTPDYGIWERGHKMNEGEAELNASSVGMAKAALEALQNFNLFGPNASPASVIHVMADDIAQARNTLEVLLPRESNSKETDAALLSVISFPAFAVESTELVARTHADIITKLQGRYGCKRFLRDGHQTMVEDHSRLHYEAGELRRFQHIESEWPLFFTYLLLDGLLREDQTQSDAYRARLETLFQVRDGQRLLPELYFVPADLVTQEQLNPQTQRRLPNENVPLVWAQSLYLLGALLQEGFLQPADIDPLSRRSRIGRQRDNQIQLALLAEDAQVQTQLQEHGIVTETLQQIQPVQIRPASDLAAALGRLGHNRALGLSGRPPRPLGSLVTCQAFTLEGEETIVFLPPLYNQRDFYLGLDNRLMAEQLKAELAYIHHHWDQPDQPLMTLLITDVMLQAGGHQIVLDFLQTLQSGCCSGATIRMGKLAELLPTAARAPMDCLNDSRFQEPAFPNRCVEAVDLNWQPDAVRPVSAAEAAAWRQQSDNHRLLQALAENRNPYEQIELLGLLWERLGPDFTDTTLSASLRQLTEAIYLRAGEARLWGVVRRAAGLLEKVDDALEDAVAAVVVRQHQLAVGRAYSDAAVIVRPLSTAEISERIRTYGGDDPRARILLQEIVLFLGMLIKAEPGRFKGVLTLRPWHLLLLITGALAREQGITQGEAFEILLDLSPYALLGRLHQVIAVDEDISHSLTRLESLHAEGGSHGLKPLRFSAAKDPTLPVGSDWNTWRESNGILTRLPEDFYSRVWEILRHCRGLIIGDQLDVRNRLDSEIILADMTATEKAFALQVEHLLNNIQAPEYRQLSIEALLALAEICRASPRLQVDDDLVLDVLIGNAVYLTWREAHPESAEGDYNEHSAEAWSAFYGKSPHQIANALILSLSFLLEANDRGVLTAA